MEKLMGGLTEDFEDEEITSESDTEVQDVDDRPHARLLDAISTLDGNRRLKHTLRTVQGQKMSEGGLQSQEVQAETLMSELMGSLQQTASFTAVKKQLKTTLEGEALETPAPKHVQEQLQRTAAYEKNVTDLAKWDPVVQANRKAEQLKFPLEQPTPKLLNTHIKYRPVTALDKEIQALLAKRNPESQLPKGEIFTPAEKRQMAAMSLEEAQRRRAELLAMRAIMYNKNCKLRWQNKIKSKRYRRALKKEKEKQAEKELEELAVADPQALVDKMEEADKKRILERGRLRHTGGKFAREAKIFAKYDDEKRQQIQEMLQKHKELVKKKVMSSSSESEDDEEDDTPKVTMTSGSTPTTKLWMRPSIATTAVKPSQPAEESGDSDEEVDSRKPEEEENADDVLSTSQSTYNKACSSESTYTMASSGQSMDILHSADMQPTTAKTAVEPPQPSMDRDYSDSRKLEKNQKKKKKKKTCATPTAATTTAVELPQPSEDRGDSEKKVDNKLQEKKKGKEKKTKQKKRDGVTGSEKKVDNKLQEKKKDKQKKKKQKKKDGMTGTGPSIGIVASTSQSTVTMNSICQSTGTVKSTSTMNRTSQSANSLSTVAMEPSSNEPTQRAEDGDNSDEMGSKKPGKTGNRKPEKQEKKKKKKETDSLRNTRNTSQSENALGWKMTDALGSSSQSTETVASTTRFGDNHTADIQSMQASDEKLPLLHAIGEMFEDDDIVEEFLNEKKEKEAAEMQEETSGDLPGWGSWAGPGVVAPQKSKKSPKKMLPPKEKEPTNQIGHVIMSSQTNSAVKKHMITKVPFPYKSLDNMKSVMSKPIGRDFNSEEAFKKKIKRRVVVSKIGQIINPINARSLMQQKTKMDMEVSPPEPVQKKRKADVEASQPEHMKKKRKADKTTSKPKRTKKTRKR